MDKFLNIVINEFANANETFYGQHRCPSSWEIVDEVGIGDDLTIIDHWALYKVPYAGGEERFVFVKTCGSNLTDFGWSQFPADFDHWFKESNETSQSVG
jgi:hypothetical protein